MLLERSYLPTGTWGRLHVLGALLWTLEPPHQVDTQGKGCIPEGTYRLELGTFYGGDGVGGAHRDYPTYELVGVPGFTEIKIHVGNWVTDTEGCLLVGEGLGVVQGKAAVVSSRVAHDRFMSLMAGRPSDEIRIRAFAP